MQKTIFITITRSFLTRNILRCGTLDELKREGYKICILFPRPTIPAYLKREFEDEKVRLVPVPTADSSRWHRLFLKMNFSNLLFSRSTITRALFFNDNARTRFFSKKFYKKTLIVPWLRYVYLRVASSLPPLKRLYRFIEFVWFPQVNPALRKVFDRYEPNLIFSTSFVSGFDCAVLKEARRRKITTVSMPKSWDNIALGYARVRADHLVVPNEPSRDVAIRLQNFPKQSVHIVGQPQFDWYVRPELIISRDDYFNKKGLDPKLPLIFFGSEGVWAAFDYEIAEMIHDWIVKDELSRPCQLLVRPHYSNSDLDIFKKLRGKKKVAVDSYRITNFLGDKWDPNKDEMVDFINTLYHCDIMINAASTLTLDAACFDKPIINVNFGCFYEGNNRNDDDITPTLYESDHFEWVFATKATKIADTPDALKDGINTYLNNPRAEAAARALLRAKLCYKIDGKSSKRLAAVLKSLL
ncbi:MAG: hypothetical protein Q8Q23_04655 [bacterium]|nr:hypothetical protein [bacterium]